MSGGRESALPLAQIGIIGFDGQIGLEALSEHARLRTRTSVNQAMPPSIVRSATAEMYAE
ncbi:hypothetical protein DFH01_25050 [Falsiroseomonas bella]|uniref:Uncharacterized protein n=1 Tax=Falsiroseomonas bella TaxID=2184016 RepID=A0A317F8F0_9PROT|nr:hypothetical protein DFH01_25050 [Falsiroseomonas bella]